MPRANRHYLPGYVWHITHRCNNRAFLLEAATDRNNWRRWLWETTSRYGLTVLNFVATCNHIHLLVYDRAGDSAVARSMQLVQGATGQAYNRRRGRRGAFWQDRHHAVAVDTNDYLWRCLIYIDLNMVRARIVSHPGKWCVGGYNEIQHPRSRYRIIDLEQLAELTECSTVQELQSAHRDQVEIALSRGRLNRDSIWTEAIAVGRQTFVDTVQSRLGLSRLQRIHDGDRGKWVLRDTEGRYVREESLINSS